MFPTFQLHEHCANTNRPRQLSSAAMVLAGHGTVPLCPARHKPMQQPKVSRLLSTHC